jgi:hypothetical protein
MTTRATVLPQEQAMNAVLREHRDSQAFFDSQHAAAATERGVTFEALYLPAAAAGHEPSIHETENIDQIMLEASQDICKLFNADRLTLYAVSEDRARPSSPRSRRGSTPAKRPEAADQRAKHRRLRGHVSKQMVNIADVYDDEALKRIHPA